MFSFLEFSFCKANYWFILEHQNISTQLLLHIRWVQYKGNPDKRVSPRVGDLKCYSIKDLTSRLEHYKYLLKRYPLELVSEIFERDTKWVNRALATLAVFRDSR